MLPPLWTQRKFELNRPVEQAANLVTRLDGAPARLEDLLRGIEEPVLRKRPRATEGNTAWGPLDHAGHLLVLDDLHYLRVREILDGAEELTAADMENKATHGANFNRQPIKPILEKFRIERSTMANYLRTLSPNDFGKSALHPRLKQPMRIIDLIEFICEHDDHHLAFIHHLIWQPPQ